MSNLTNISDFYMGCNVTSQESRYMHSLNMTDYNFDCNRLFHHFLSDSRLIFDLIHVIRISVAWSAFVVSFLGNMIVLLSVTLWRRNNNMTHTQTLMLNIALANLSFTAFVMPTDAIWQTTMQWYGGSFLCKLVNSMKQFSMYVSSCMVATMEIDRAIGLLRPVSPAMLKRRLRSMLIVTWTVCFVGAFPAFFIFESVEHNPARCHCRDESMTILQCVDFLKLKKHSLDIFHFYTLAMSFILPVLIIIICFGIIAFRITELAKKARETELRSAGFRNLQSSASPQRKSLVRKSLERARHLSQLVTVFITVTFLLCWGPYYVVAIVQWGFDEKFIGEMAENWMLMTLYLNPCFHPLIIILLLKDVRRNLDCNLPFRIRFNYLGNKKCSGSSSRSMSHGSPRNMRVIMNDMKGHSRTTHV